MVSGELKPFVEDVLLGDETRKRGFYDMKRVETGNIVRSHLVGRFGALSRIMVQTLFQCSLSVQFSRFYRSSIYSRSGDCNTSTIYRR